MRKEYAPGFGSLSLTYDMVLKEIGYEEVLPEELIGNRIKTIFDDISGITDPLITYCVREGEVTDSSVILENSEEIKTGNTIASLLANSTRFALFVCTAGKAFQAYQDELKEKNDLLDVFIADSIGSCIPEKAGDYMERMIEKEIGTELHTNRFSPGYCGWHLQSQEQLFRHLGGKPCGVELSDVYLMNPIKSISGIVGIGTHVNQKAYGCQYCELETCYKRNKRNK